MIDRFFYNHFEYRLDSGKAMVHEKAFEDLYEWVKKGVKIPDDDLLDASNYIQVHERFYLLELDWFLRELPRHSQIGRLMIEAALLHVFQMAHLKLGDKITPRQVRSMVALRAVAQKRLSEVILQVAPEQLATIMQLGRLPNMDADNWKQLFAYAMSFAYAVQVFDSLEECSVYPANLHERIDIGLDLIVTDNDSCKGYCVQVNCAIPEHGFWSEHVYERPFDRETDTKSMRRKRIFDGTERFNDFNRRDCSAVRINVGKVGDEIHSLDPLEHDRARLRKLFERIESRDRREENRVRERV